MAKSLPHAGQIQCIVTDIEGTTTAISFVHDVLFPYARERLPEFLRQHAEEDAVSEQLAATAAEAGLVAGSLDALTQVLLRWIDEDRKATPLKVLQGMVWKQGYADGQLKGHIYPDAAAKLRAWHGQGKRLYVYSSGSVAAQKLLFGYTTEGDLTPLFDGYFDTRVGHKSSVDSYRAILRQLPASAAATGLLSDVGAELDAARQAGMQTAWVVRDAEPDPQARHRQVGSLADVDW